MLAYNISTVLSSFGLCTLQAQRGGALSHGMGRSGGVLDEAGNAVIIDIGDKFEKNRNGSALGTMGLANSASSSGERSAPVGWSGVLPRVSTAAIQSAGGTVPKLIAGLIDALKGGTMEVKERAVSALHSLADMAKENADLIGREGLTHLIALLDDGSCIAQAHAAGAIDKLAFGNRDMQLRIAKIGGVVSLAGIQQRAHSAIPCSVLTRVPCAPRAQASYALAPAPPRRQRRQRSRQSPSRPKIRRS